MNTKTLAGEQKKKNLEPPFSSEKSGLFLSAKASGGSSIFKGVGMWEQNYSVQFTARSTSSIKVHSATNGGTTSPSSSRVMPRFGAAQAKLALSILLMTLAVVLIAGSRSEATQLQASWYSIQSLKKEGTWRYSHGRMANGHLFNDANLTCATRLYPLGTRLVVKNLNNGKSVIVLVADRIGARFAQTRVDLSKSAFASIADLRRGLIPISVEVLK